MRRSNECVFDDMLFDAATVCIGAEDTAVDGKIPVCVTFEHSVDGRTWTDVAGATSIELTLSPGMAPCAVAHLLGRAPRLRFTRLKVRPTGAPVRVYVTRRDTQMEEADAPLRGDDLQ